MGTRREFWASAVVATALRMRSTTAAACHMQQTSALSPASSKETKPSSSPVQSKGFMGKQMCSQRKGRVLQRTLAVRCMVSRHSR